MTHEQRSKAANQQDPKWAANVVRNIGQIEADFFHAAGPVSERIMAEAFLRQCQKDCTASDGTARRVK